MTTIAGLSPTLSYQVLQRSQERQLEAFAEQPVIKRNLDAFKANAPQIKTVDQLLDDRRSLEVVLSAFQLEEQINARAFLKKIISEPIDDSDSLVNKLIEPRYKALAESLQGLAAGEDPFSNPAKVTEIADQYLANEFEKAVGETTPGIREALYFKRTIGDVENLSQLLANPTLKDVARVAAGLPQDILSLDFDQQQPRFEEKIDVEKLKDPKFLDTFLRRYLVRVELEQPVQDPIVDLLSPIALRRPEGVPGTINIVV